MHADMPLTIATNGIGLMLNNTLMRINDERRSRKLGFIGRLNHHGLRFRGRKPDPGPLLRTNT
eukprot:5012316-Amphidinium_carterae.1